MLTKRNALPEGPIERFEEARRDALDHIATAPAPKLRRPVVVALFGLALVGLSAVALTVKPSEQAIPATAGRPAGIVTTDLVYEPGHSSGWHVHPGVHSVVVLAGTLTVYDEGCRRYDYGPGQTYVGGHAPHLARNGGTEALALVAIYVADPSSDRPGNTVAAPSGCDAL